MPNIDIYQAMTAIKNDAVDTQAKISYVVELFSKIHNAMLLTYQDDMVGLMDQINDFRLDPKLRDGFSFSILNIVFSIRYFEDDRMIDPGGMKGYDYFEIRNDHDIVKRMGWDLNPLEMDQSALYAEMEIVDGQQTLTTYSPEQLEQYDFSQVTLKTQYGNFNMAAAVDGFKSSLQCQDLLTDISDLINSNSNLQILIAKWNNRHDLTAGAKLIYDDFLANGSINRDKAMAWIASLFKETSDTSESDGKLSFSNTNYKVMFCWSTLIDAIGNLVQAAVTTIAMVVRGVFALVAGVCSVVASALSRLWSAATNPMMEYQEELRATLNIPIAQIILPESSGWNILKHFKAITADYPMFTMRYWYDEEQEPDNRGHMEVFLRPMLTPMNVHYIRSGYGSSAFPNGWRGFPGLNQIATAIAADKDENRAQCGPIVCASEFGQATVVGANLYALIACMMDFTGIDTSWQDDFDPVSDYWNVINDTSLTLAQRMGGVYGILRRCWQVCYADLSDVVKDQTTFGQTVGTMIMSWEKLCNRVIPLIREWWTAAPLLPYGPDLQGLVNTENLNIDIDNGYTYELGAISNKTFGISLPRSSSDGLLLGLVVTFVATTAITIAATIVALKVKKKVAEIRQRKMAEAQEKQKKYVNSINGIDNSDPTGATHREYTKAEQKQLFNDYYKAARSYNRWSVLWGGDTFNLVNGWSDGTATPNAVDTPAQTLLNTGLQLLNPEDDVDYSVNDIFRIIRGTPVID